MPYVYFIQKGNRDVYKVGMTSGSAEDRLKGLQTSSDEPLTLCAVVECKNTRAAIRLERGLHNVFSTKRLSGEWFSLTWSDIQGVMRYYEGRGYKTQHPNGTIEYSTRFTVNRRGATKDEENRTIRRALARVAALEKANAELTGLRRKQIEDAQRLIEEQNEEIAQLEARLLRFNPRYWIRQIWAFFTLNSEVTDRQ